jgi:hypothetical protein
MQAGVTSRADHHLDDPAVRGAACMSAPPLAKFYGAALGKAGDIPEKAAASEPEIRVRDLAGRHAPRNRGNRKRHEPSADRGIAPDCPQGAGTASSSGHARVLGGHGTVIVRCEPVTVSIQRGVQPPHVVSRRRCLVAASPLSARGFTRFV